MFRFRMENIAATIISVVCLFSFPQVANAQQFYDISGYQSVQSYYDELAAGELARVIVRVDLPISEIRNLGIKNATRDAISSANQSASSLGIRSRRIADTALIVLDVSRQDLDQLLAALSAASVVIDVPERAQMASALPAIEGNLMHAEGAEGLGRTIVILDTGVNADHAFFGDRVVAEACFSTNSIANSSTSVCPNGLEEEFGAGSGEPCGIAGCNHGTHVAGIAAGNDVTNTGVAPEANIIAIQVFSVFNDVAVCDTDPVPCVRTFRSDQIAALRHVLNTLSTQHPISAVNMSIGGGEFASCPNDLRAPTIADLRARGIATVIASGNDSDITTVGAPGCIPDAITVGATNDAGTVANFSNSGPALDIMAPGVAITSAADGGGTVQLQGTSMAAPMVAGAIASLQSYLVLPIDDLEGILEATGNPVATLNPAVNRPMLRLLQAWQAIDARVPAGEFVWMRDTWNDTGLEPDPAVANQTLSSSPDIWVRHLNDCDTNQHQHQNPEFGQPNVGCISIRNSGRSQATGTLRFYFANANFDSGASWTLIDEEAMVLPPQTAAIQPIIFNNVPAPGHYCLIARWFPEGSADTLEFPGGFVNAVRNSNDLVWKNVTVVDVNQSSVSSKLVFEPGNDGSINMVVDISSLTTSELAQLGELIITLGGDPSDLSNEGTSKYYQHEGRSVLIPLKPGVYYIPEIMIPTDQQSTFELEFKFHGDETHGLKNGTIANIDIFDVPDVAAHKQGQIGEYPSIRYALTAQ